MTSVGIVAAFGVTRLMTSLLFGVAPTDAAAYVAALEVILGATALASYLPARRAAASDPTVVGVRFRPNCVIQTGLIEYPCSNATGPL